MIYIKKNWYEILKPEFEKPYFQKMLDFLETEYRTKTIYPKVENIFNALNLVKYEDVRVVFIGQDPYHEPNQAHGLCFSVENDKLPPSLQNIFKELKAETGIVRTNGNLTDWAEQGILMLNAVLTVEKGLANSHKDIGWQTFTNKIIRLLNEKNQPIVFVLWGSQAQKNKEFITNPKHLVLCSSHPSPLSAYNGFFGNNHFNEINRFLKSNNMQEIKW